MESNNNTITTILLFGIMALFLAISLGSNTVLAKSKVPPSEPVLHTIKGKVNLVDHERIVLDDFSFHLPPGTSGIAKGDYVELTFDDSGKIVNIKRVGKTEATQTESDRKGDLDKQPPEKASDRYHPGQIRKEGGRWKNY